MEMTKPLNRADLTRAAQLLGDAHALLIVNELLGGRRRFGALQTALTHISPQMLSGRLKVLEANGFITRDAYAEIPPRVEYELTEKGAATADILRALAHFAERYMPETDDCEPTSPQPPPLS